MIQRKANVRTMAEIFIAAMIGAVIAWKSSWCDLDEPLVPSWYILLLTVGVAFGFVGRSRIWLVAAAMSCVPLYAALVPMRWAFSFELFLFGWMFLFVFIGSGIGRGVKGWVKSG